MKYEDALLDLAKAEARRGESLTGCLGRLNADQDPRLIALLKAAQDAEEVRDLGREQRGEEMVSKRCARATSRTARCLPSPSPALAMGRTPRMRWPG